MTGTVELPQRLAAILAADAVGFSSLMANDERATLAALEDARAVFRAQVAQQGGRVVDTAGDSVLAVFDSASAAVGAAMAVQEALEGRTTQAPGTARLRYRIGIHLGEVLTQPDGSVYGDGVNTAARLQAVAEPGRIVVSAAVRGAIGTRLGVGFDDLGERAFKNLAAPLRAFRVQGGAATAHDTSAAARRWPRPSRLGVVGLLAAGLAAAAGLWALAPRPAAVEPAAGASVRTITVAVLPFTATGAGPADTVWAETMTGALTNALSRWGEASVAAPGQVRKLQGQGLDPGEVGRALQVRYLVEGEIAPRGGKLVVAPRVIDAGSSRQVWAREIELPQGAGDDERELLQQRVVILVRGVLTNAHLEEWRRLPAGSPEALLARGWDLWSNGEAADWRAVRGHFERALELDPRFALAIVLRGWTFEQEYTADPSMPKAVLAELEAASAQAIAVAPGLADGWALRSFALGYLRRFGEAFAAIDRAIALEPYNPKLIAFRANLFQWTGRQQEAEALVLRAIAMNPPGAIVMHRTLCGSRLLMGRYDEALAACEFAATGVLWFEDQMLLAAIHAQRGHMAKAVVARDEMLKQQPGATLASNLYLHVSVEPEFRRQVEEHLIAGLRKAGIRER